MSNKKVSVNWGCLVGPTMIMVGLIFLTLKLIGIGLPSEWSWYIVLLPWYGPPAIMFLMWVTLIALSVVFGFWATVIGNYGRRLRRKNKEREQKERQRGLDRCKKCGEIYIGLPRDCRCTREK